MDIWDSQRIKEIRDNTAKMADAFTRIADTLERLADRKADNRSEKPNNCETCIWSVCNYNKAFEDEPQTEYERASEQREHDILYEPTYNKDDGSM